MRLQIVEKVHRVEGLRRRQHTGLRAVGHQSACGFRRDQCVVSARRCEPKKEGCLHRRSRPWRVDYYLCIAVVHIDVVQAC